jgi:hypothetical protein
VAAIVARMGREGLVRGALGLDPLILLIQPLTTLFPPTSQKRPRAAGRRAQPHVCAL